MPTTNNLLKTKFFLPQPTSDFVERKHLQHMFEQLETSSLMLVSASTGFGKSTVVANYIAAKIDNHVWLSLSAKENDIREFIRYFIAALQQNNPEVGEKSLELLQTAELPLVEELAELLINDLAELSEPIYMAIDDYHHIQNRDIHEFIAKLFEYPQTFFKLIIITRYDPQLPLPAWRNKNNLIEIRSRDLKFSSDEISVFCQKAMDYIPTKSILKKMKAASEGWISGLRMILLSTAHGKDIDTQLENFSHKNSKAFTDLLLAVIEILPDTIQEQVLKLSTVREFNEDLFAALCLNSDQQKSRVSLFSDFVNTLIKSNMFIIPLDDRHNWFRFHHFFADQLYEIFRNNHSEELVNATIEKAALWYQQNELPEESIEKYLEINELGLALEIFVHYRVQLITTAQFSKLEYIFNFFPKEVVEENGILYLTAAWLQFFKGNIKQMADMLGAVEQVVLQETLTQEERELLLGEIYALQSYDYYLLHVDIKKCLEISGSSIQLLKNHNPYASGLAWIFYGASMQILNQGSQARKELVEELEHAEHPSMKGQLLLIIWYIDWFEGNLSSALRVSEQLIEIGLSYGDRMSIAHGYCFQGLTLYQGHENQGAIAALKNAMDLSRYFALKVIGFPSWLKLSKLYTEAGKSQEAEQVMEMCRKFAYRHGDAMLIKIMEAHKADVDWGILRKVNGLNWAMANDYTTFLPLNDLYSPEIEQAKLLALSDNPEALDLAVHILEILSQFFEPRNNALRLAQIYAIWAVVTYKQGDPASAITHLKKALSLSEVGYMRRIYLELGVEMKELMVMLNGENRRYAAQIDHIIHQFKENGLTSSNIRLSARELEILQLSQQMTNKEVGEKLFMFIAEKTVKTHITNINKKLSASNKKEALSLAVKLQLL